MDFVAHVYVAKIFIEIIGSLSCSLSLLLPLSHEALVLSSPVVANAVEGIIIYKIAKFSSRSFA